MNRSRNKGVLAIAGLSLALLSAAGSVFADAPATNAALSPAVSAVADATVRDRFAGTYTYAGGDKQKAGIDVAIENAIDGLFFVAKPVARSKLHEKTAIKNSVGFQFANGNVIGTATDASPTISKDDGTSAPYKVDGETLRVLQKVTPEAHLLQTFASADGTRLNDYTLSADAKILTMTATITSGRLPHPLRFTLTYRRN